MHQNYDHAINYAFPPLDMKSHVLSKVKQE